MKNRLPASVLLPARAALLANSTLSGIGDHELEAAIWAALDALLGTGREDLGVGFVEDLLRDLRIVDLRVFDRRCGDDPSGIVLTVLLAQGGYRSTPMMPSLLEAVREARALQGIARDGSKTEYDPSSVSPPGATISELLQMRNWTVEEFAGLSHLGVACIQGLLAGTEIIDQTIARKLEKLGGTAMFWIRREAQYRASLTKKEAG